MSQLELLWGGVPARVIGSFDELKKNREAYSREYSSLSLAERTEKAWIDFSKEKYSL